MNFTKIDGRGQRKTQRGVCSHAHGKRAGLRIQVIAWQNVLLTGLRPVFGTTPPSTTTSVPSRRGETVIYRSFGTATLPTGTSVASPRGEGVIYRVFGTATLPTGTSVASRRDKGGFYPVFGTATLPTSISVASSRGETVIHRSFATAIMPTDASMGSSRCHCELVHRIVALLGFVKFTWNEPLLIIK